MRIHSKMAEEAVILSSCYFTCYSGNNTLPAYPDIDGYRTLIGFVGTGYLMVIFLLMYYLTGFNPELDPFRDEADWSKKAPRCNPVDVVLLAPVHRILFRSGSGSIPSKWLRREKFFNKVVLTFCDLQLVTGMGILISGFCILRNGITTFHWQIMVYTAWFSSTTHLAALTILRKYLHNHPVERTWRLLGMGIFLVLLVVAIVPTGSYSFFTSFSSGIPAVCYYENLEAMNLMSCDDDDDDDDDDPFVPGSMAISVLLLAVGFVSRTVRLHQPLVDSLHGKLRLKLGQKLRDRILWLRAWERRSRHPLRRTLVYYPVIAAYLTLRLSVDIFGSMFFEAYWLVAATTWGSWRLFTTRFQTDVEIDTIGSAWTFGQILPIILLLGPLITTAECFYDGKNGIDSTAGTAVPPTSAVLAHSSSDVSLPLVHGESPDDDVPELSRDNYSNVTWFRHLLWVIAVFLVSFTEYSLAFIGGSIDPHYSGPTYAYLAKVFGLQLPMCVWVLALMNLCLEDLWMSVRYAGWFYAVFQVLCITLMMAFARNPYGSVEGIPMVILAAMSLYFVGCLLHGMWCIYRTKYRKGTQRVTGTPTATC